MFSHGRVPSMAVLVACTLGLLATVVRMQAEDPKPESAAALIDAGKKCFEERDFREAGKIFRKAKPLADKLENEAIEAYLRACKGGEMLGAIEKATDKKQWRLAQLGLSELLAKYGDSPLQLHIRPLRERIENEAYVYLATYEKDAPKYEPGDTDFRDDVGYNENSEFIRSGQRSLKWEVRKNPSTILYCPLASFEDLKMEDYGAIEFSLYNLEEMNPGALLIFHYGDLGGIAYHDGRIGSKPCYYHRLRIPQLGWNDIRVELSELKRNGQAQWAGLVGAILVDVECKDGKKTVYLDDVRLCRK